MKVMLSAIMNQETGGLASIVALNPNQGREAFRPSAHDALSLIIKQRSNWA